MSLLSVCPPGEGYTSQVDASPPPSPAPASTPPPDVRVEEGEGCVVCGARSSRLAYPVRDLLWDQPGSWSFVLCDGCGHGALQPRPDASALQSLYATLYDPARLEMMVRIGEGGFDQRLQRARVRAILASRRPGEAPPRRLLDVGCGLGLFLQKLSQAFPDAEAIGVELAPPTAARAAALPGLQIHQRPFTALALPAESVDVLCMNHLLEHLPEPRRELAQAAVLLAPGGLLEIEIPQLHGWARSAFGRWYWPHLPPQHLHLFHEAGLRRLLAEVGLDEVCRVERDAYPLHWTVAFVLWMKFTLGSQSPFATRWLVRGPATAVGILLLPMVLLLDATLTPLLNAWRGDILRVVVRKSSSSDVRMGEEAAAGVEGVR